MDTGSRPRSSLHRSFGMSLRVKVALGVALPILLVLTLLSFMRFWREGQFLENQLELTVSQLGDVMMGSLHHALLTNDREMISQSVSDMGGMKTVRWVQIIDPDGQVTADSRSENVGCVRGRCTGRQAR